MRSRVALGVITSKKKILENQTTVLRTHRGPVGTSSLIKSSPVRAIEVLVGQSVL